MGHCTVLGCELLFKATTSSHLPPTISHVCTVPHPVCYYFDYFGPNFRPERHGTTTTTMTHARVLSRLCGWLGFLACVRPPYILQVHWCANMPFNRIFLFSVPDRTTRHDDLLYLPQVRLLHEIHTHTHCDGARPPMVIIWQTICMYVT